MGQFIFGIAYLAGFIFLQGAQDSGVLELSKPVTRELGGSEAHSYQITLAAGQFLKALGYFNRALPLNQAAGDRSGEAITRYNIGLIYNELGEPQKALECYHQALAIYLAAKNRWMEAATLGNIGSVYSRLGEPRKALDYYSRALVIKRDVGDQSGEATLLNNIGFIYSNIGEPQKALEIFNQALPIYRAIGNRSAEATTLNNIGKVYDDSGEYKKALEIYKEVIEIKRASGNSVEEAIALSNIGVVYDKLGEYQKALDYHNQALQRHRAAGVRSGQAVTLSNIGQVYSRLGDHQKELDYYNQALSILRDIGDSAGQAATLNNIAHIYSDSGEKQKALEFYEKSLKLRQASNDRRGEAVTLNNIGSLYQDLGETQKALEYSNRSLTALREMDDRLGQAVALNNIASIYKKLGESQKALDYYNQSVALLEYTGNRNEEAGVLYNIAVVERDRGNLVEARKYIDKTITTIESIRMQVKSPEMRASFFASMQKYYKFDIEVLMRLHKQRPSEGFGIAALNVSERLRARSLLEMLKEVGAEIRQGVDPTLLERERVLRQTIADKAERQTRLLSGKHSQEQAAAATKEIDSLTTEYEQVQAQIRYTSPRYYSLNQPVPLSLNEIQTEVLDNETLLLEYSLDDEKSFLWAVTKTSINSFELPKRAETEAVARRVYDMLISRNQSISSETPEQRRLRVDLAEAEYPKAAAALSQMLLGPVASQLGNKRLLIVSEGMLQYVPFAALPAPESGGAGERGSGRVGEGKSGRAGDEHDSATSPTPPLPRSPALSSAIRNLQSLRPLILDHEIVSLPSASVLAVQRKELVGRKPAPKIVAVLADPVFRSDDPRIAQVGRSQAARVEEVSTVADVKRSASESGLEDFVRLRFSRQEAEQITRLAPNDKGLKALDFSASRASAMSADLGQYKIVHFATHALINSRHPELSGIVLSLVDEQGRPQNGFLRLHEIYNLRLGADLVVLSACQTALGKDVKGEGLVGLTRGFMYAGSPRVVASLWRIDDRATAELMGRFYEGMLGRGLTAAAALRAAQLEMWKDKRWKSPHYWAGLTLQGEWK